MRKVKYIIHVGTYMNIDKSKYYEGGEEKTGYPVVLCPRRGRHEARPRRPKIINIIWHFTYSTGLQHLSVEWSHSSSTHAHTAAD